MDPVIRLEHAPSRPTAVVRRHAKQHELAQVIPAACGAVWSLVRALNLPGVGRHVALYLDCQFTLEIGVELDAPFAGHGELLGSALPAGLVAATTHHGPYDRLAAAHQALHRWCEANGHALAGPSWEVYGHWQPEWNDDPSRIVTDVCYLLAGDAA